MEIFSFWHILVLVIIALLLFGPKRLPEFAKSLGEGIREFKKALSAAVEEPSKPTPPSAIEPHQEPTQKPTG